MSKVKISVTQDDIDDGVPGHPYACAINRALRRVYPKKIVAVEKDRVYFVRRPNDVIEHMAMLPHVAAIFVRAYDNGEEVAPFAFDLEIPE